MNLEALLAEARDPQTPGSRLAELAYQYPDTRLTIALNSSTYPELLDWLAKTGDPQLNMVINARVSSSPSPDTRQQIPPSQAKSRRRRSGWWIGAVSAGAVALVAGGIALPSFVTAQQIDTCSKSVHDGIYREARLLELPETVEEMLGSTALSGDALTASRREIRSTIKTIDHDDLLCVGYFNKTDGRTGKLSSVTIAMATNSQELAPAINSHARSLRYIPGNRSNELPDRHEYERRLNTDWKASIFLSPADHSFSPDEILPSEFKEHSLQDVAILLFHVSPA